MYVIHARSSTICMYNVDTFRELDGAIAVDGMTEPTDIVVCPVDQQVYVADWKECVWQVSAVHHTYCRWLTTSRTFRPYTLSVTSRRLLVTSREPPTLHQYSADRELLNEVKMPRYLEQLSHGVETTRGTYVICHHGTVQSNRKGAVSEVDKTGAVLSTFTDVDGPGHLSLMSDGRVLVADYRNHRILMLDSQLQLQRALFDGRKSEVDLWGPFRLCHEEPADRLYIVHDASKLEWVPNDVITSWQLRRMSANSLLSSTFSP